MEHDHDSDSEGSEEEVKGRPWDVAGRTRSRRGRRRGGRGRGPRGSEGHYVKALENPLTIHPGDPYHSCTIDIKNEALAYIKGISKQVTTQHLDKFCVIGVEKDGISVAMKVMKMFAKRNMTWWFKVTVYDKNPSTQAPMNYVTIEATAVKNAGADDATTFLTSYYTKAGREPLDSTKAATGDLAAKVENLTISGKPEDKKDETKKTTPAPTNPPAYFAKTESKK